MSILTHGIAPGSPALHLEYCGKSAICLYRAPGRGRPTPSGVSIYRLRGSPATEMQGGFWHRPPTILIRNGLLETVADQHHQNLRGKGNAVIRSPTRHHIERASDVLPSVQPRCFALQRPLMKRGWRCYAVQDRYVEKGAGEKGRGARTYPRVSTPSHRLRLPPSQQAWARDVGVSQREPIAGISHRDCPSHPAATSSMFAASCGHRYGPIETNRKIWQCHLALPPPSLAARKQGGPI